MSSKPSQAEKELFAKVVNSLSLKDSKESKTKVYNNVKLENRVADIADVNGECFLEYSKDGIQNKKMQQLRKGLFQIEAQLDLHGYTIQETNIAIERFIQNSLAQKYKVVIIIHGKGSNNAKPAILKNHLNKILRKQQYILAFCSAKEYDGGTGAMYVMLKNLREENNGKK